jgi:hypothetical protein
MILAETLNFSMWKFKVSARIVVSDKLIPLFSGRPEIYLKLSVYQKERTSRGECVEGRAITVISA